jgi:hypothetical protein
MNKLKLPPYQVQKFFEQGAISLNHINTSVRLKRCSASCFNWSFFRDFEFFLLNYFFVFFYYFDVLILKINLKI